MESVQSKIDALEPNDDWGVEAARLLLCAADEMGCSDLHIASQRHGALARGRRHGGLFTLAQIPAERRDLLLARFKVMARLPAFVRHEPQDGRIEWPGGPGGPGGTGGTGGTGGGGSPAILRCSFLPTLHGENLVVRFPERAGEVLELEALGMPQEVLSGVDGLLSRQEGVILLTGPSSSGKTTTMYAMLQRLHARHGERLNFLTIEDPIERDLGFAGQTQVNLAQGLTFERALRASLRQDPNVLMIGEIRDEETARIAVQAGMSGHLVVTTVHAGRACRVFSRLLSMGMAPYLAASALSGAVAQRLARVLCPDCREEDPRHPGAFIAKGCASCAEIGCQGRTGMFELAEVSERLRELILARATVDQIASEAKKTQIGDLPSQGLALVERGVISRAEYEYLFSEEVVADRQRD